MGDNSRDAASIQIEHVKTQQCENSTAGCVKYTMARDAASVQIEHDALWVTIVDNVKSQQQAVSNRQWLEMQHPYR